MVDEVKDRAVAIFNILDGTYPDAGPTIHYSDPFQLLIASILGARATDESVNRITPFLFSKYQGPEEFARADYDILLEEIHDVGLAEAKAGYIIESSRLLLERHNGHVPCSLDELIALPGVGRKIANMVLGNVCGQPAMIVDTHVNRVSHRLGLMSSTNPTIAERQLTAVLPSECWTRWNHLVIAHGRKICVAKNPRCAICPVLHLCPYGSSRVPKTDI